MKGWNKIVVVFVVFFSVFLCKTLLAGQGGHASSPDIMIFPDAQGIRNVAMTSNDACPTREELISKTQTLRVPFIANNGQVDAQVRFYAKTFGGTVFVTKDGEIVYSLPEGRGRDVPAGASQQDTGAQQGAEEQRCGGAWGLGNSGAEGRWGKNGRQGADGWHGQALLVHAESEFAAHGYLPFFRADNATCPPGRIFAKSLLAAYLPGLQKETTQRVVSTPATSNPGVVPANNNPQSAFQIPKSPTRAVALKEQLVGGKINEIKGGAQSVTTVSYFKGNDPSKWESNISTYEVVDMGEVYKGIGLRLKAYGNNVEKLFTVKPGGDPGRIKISLRGVKECGMRNAGCGIENTKSDASTSPSMTSFRAESRNQNPKLQINKSGELEVETELGTVKFTKPIAYQEVDGKRVEVACEYTILECVNKLEFGFWNLDFFSIPQSEFRIPKSTNSDSQNPKLEYGFTVASYDKTKDLIIDPLLASTFLGGSYYEWGNSLALDTSGNVYVTGGTISTDFPTTSGAYDTSYNGGMYMDDAFVSKLNSGLTSLLASTYLGGGGNEGGNSLALDTSGNVYVTGKTGSTDFPTTSGTYDTSYNVAGDVFVSKLNSGLTSLLASTFLGGSSSDEGDSLSLDTSGNVYVTGFTYSADFPTTSGAYDISFNGGYADVFVSKLNSGLTSLLASAFLGGGGNEGGSSLALDTSGNVYVTGATGSTDFPTTSGAYDTSFNGSDGDVFVSKLNGGLTILLASTFLGGSDGDFGNSLTLDTGGNVYVTGVTESTDFPTMSGAYDTSHNGGGWDVFVSHLNSGLTSLLASTFLGGRKEDQGNSLTLDTSGNVYVTGYTASTNFPTTSGAYDTSFNGGGDVFVSKLNGGLTSLLASTFLGGYNGDGGKSLTLDTSGNVYVTGSTGSTNFPTTSGAYDVSFNSGDTDVFVSKLNRNLSATDDCMAESITATPARLTLRKGKNGDVTITVTGAGDCPVEGVTVTATIKGNGKLLISVSPKSRETDANGQAMFIINAKEKKGTAVIRFRASGLSKSKTVQVQVR